MTRQNAIDIFGGVQELARALGITDKAVYQWGEIVPELRVYQIRELQARKATLADRT